MDWSKVEGARQQRRTIIYCEKAKTRPFFVQLISVRIDSFSAKGVAESTLTQSTDGITILT